MRSHVRFTRPTFVGSHSHAAGEVAELDEHAADRLIRAGLAERVVVVAELVAAAEVLEGAEPGPEVLEEPGQVVAGEATEAQALAAVRAAARRSKRVRSSGG